MRIKEKKIQIQSGKQERDLKDPCKGPPEQIIKRKKAINYTILH